MKGLNLLNLAKFFLNLLFITFFYALGCFFNFFQVLEMYENFIWLNILKWICVSYLKISNCGFEYQITNVKI